MVIGCVGNPDLQGRGAHDVEGGYRLDLGRKASLDVTAFRGRYTGLPTSEPLAPGVRGDARPRRILFIATRLQNLLHADTAGIEIAAQLTPLPTWRLEASYSGFNLTPASFDPTAATTTAASVRRQRALPSMAAPFHCQARPPHRRQRPAVQHGPLRTTRRARLHARRSARVEVRLTGYLSAIAAPRNLLDSSHAEFLARSVTSDPDPAQRGRSAGLAILRCAVPAPVPVDESCGWPWRRRSRHAGSRPPPPRRPPRPRMSP